MEVDLVHKSAILMLAQTLEKVIAWDINLGMHNQKYLLDDIKFIKDGLNQVTNEPIQAKAI